MNDSARVGLNLLKKYQKFTYGILKRSCEQADPDRVGLNHHSAPIPENFQELLGGSVVWDAR